MIVIPKKEKININLKKGYIILSNTSNSIDNLGAHLYNLAKERRSLK